MVYHRVIDRLYIITWASIVSTFMNIALFSPPPVGLISADDVTEGFPLDLCVPSRALQGNYMAMLDNISKTLVKLLYLCGEEGHL